MTEAESLGRISSESVREATGRRWEEWLEALDAAGAADWDHKEIVAYLEHSGVTSGWWRQSITVECEQRWREALERIAAAAV